MLDSKNFAKAYQAPPGLMQMANNLRNSNAGVVVLSCSDPRIHPEQILGLDSTLSKSTLSLNAGEMRRRVLRHSLIAEATMVRNAGGRVFDAIRTFAVLQTIGSPATIVVMHHTGRSYFVLRSTCCLIRDICGQLTDFADCGLTHFHDKTVQDALIGIAPDEADSIKGSKFGEITGL